MTPPNSEREKKMDEPDFEKLILDAMLFLTAPDNPYRQSDAIVDLAYATDKTQRSHDRCARYWAERASLAKSND